MLVIGCLLLSSTAFAQFTGPAASGRVSTVEDARKAPVDTYVTVTGNILSHLREDYYTFRDQTGEVRVEIEPPVWQNRKIGPDTKVRLVAEVDRNASGTIYLWVESLQIAD
nr:NirD/YgiW/YdeI family stress tolerance protein [Thiorhodovibrio winogradskyi]